MQGSELDRIMAQIKTKYAVEVVPSRIGDKTLQILQLRDFEDYVERIVEVGVEGAIELPYWAKVWDATFLLAYFLGKQPVVLGQRVLEIGAGIGVIGVYAALCGHNVTITDINEDALLFARANALLNKCPQVEVRKLDWRESNAADQYDMIVGSEVIYDRKSYPALIDFLRTTLTTEGTIFLSKNAQLPTSNFFPELTKYFKFKQTVQTVNVNGEPQQIVLYAIRHKTG